MVLKAKFALGSNRVLTQDGHKTNLQNPPERAMKIKIVCALMMVLLLQACSNDEPSTKPTQKPAFVMTDGYGLMTDDADHLEPIDGITQILRLSVCDNQLYVLGKGTQGNLVMWHDGQVRDIDITPAEGTWLSSDSPEVDKGNAYYMYRKGEFDNGTYFVKGFPNGKTIELEPLPGASPEIVQFFPISFRVHDEHVYACAAYTLRYEYPWTTYGSAYVWIDGKVVQLSTEPNVTIGSLDGNNGHYVAVGTRGTTDEGLPGVALIFSYTNKGEEIDTFRTQHWIKVYQNGVECDTSIHLDGELMDTGSWGKSVQPGATLKVMPWFFAIPEDTDTIDIELVDRASPSKTAGIFTVVLPD